ncbi:GNAT family N-acetyltransferase [Planotetraspora sp. GP83]|uniref:GNAT family N-acetyltransferase n=1 Tax=Planotetraspora sp. GP83 TaxID=3156264 RepID=UPI00351676F6
MGEVTGEQADGQMAGGIGRLVKVEVLDAVHAMALADEVGAVYQAAFGAPPNSEGPEQFAHQQATYQTLLGRRGFRLAIARRAERLVGFGYGAFLQPDTAWWDGMLEPLEPDFIAETGDRTFALIDMGVLPDARRQGIGRALHDAVLSGCGARRATLAVEPRLEANQRLYRSWGWQCAGRLTGAPGDIADAYDIYVRDLPVPRP